MAAGSDDQARKPQAAPRRRSSSSAFVGVVVVAASLALFLLLNQINEPAQRQVLMLSRDVAPGSVLEDRDLLETTIRGSVGFAAVSAADRREVRGLSTRTALFKDSLLTRSALRERERLSPGEAVVSVVLRAGRSPSPRSGDTVLAVAPPGATGSAVDVARPFQQRAVVRSVRDGPGSGETTVFLLVNSEQAAVNISVAAATAPVSLILVP